MDHYLYMNIATALMVLGVIAFIVHSIKEDHHEEVDREKFYEEEKEALGNQREITLTRAQMERYFETVLDLTAKEKLNVVHIHDTKERPQGVLLSYGEYKALCAFKELYTYNAHERIKERQLWQEAALKASLDEDYLKELHERG